MHVVRAFRPAIAAGLKACTTALILLTAAASPAATHERQCIPHVVNYATRLRMSWQDDITLKVVTEYFDRFSAYGSDWLTVLTAVDDPKYLSQEYLTSTHFKRESDSSKFSPSRCE
jgi:hypothetical protein